MPAKRRGVPTWVFLVGGALVFSLYLFGKFLGQKTILKAVMGEPAVVLDQAMQSARVSPRITSRIGDVNTRKFKLNKIGTQKDTLIFRLLVEGERGDATLKLWMVERPPGQWQIVKSDTLFTLDSTLPISAK